PEQLARLFVEGAELAVEVRRGDEDQAAGGHDGAPVVLASRVLQALRGELGMLAERNLPRAFAGIEIDCVQGSPRRRDGGVAVGVEELLVSGEPVGGRA